MYSTVDSGLTITSAIVDRDFTEFRSELETLLSDSFFFNLIPSFHSSHFAHVRSVSDSTALVFWKNSGGDHRAAVWGGRLGGSGQIFLGGGNGAVQCDVCKNG